MNGGTNIALAIKQAGQLLKSEDADASRVIILLTDGRVDTFQGKLGKNTVIVDNSPLYANLQDIQLCLTAEIMLLSKFCVLCMEVLA